VNDDEHATTHVLKRVAPFWAWVRKYWPVLVSISGTSVVWLVAQSFAVGGYQTEFRKIAQGLEDTNTQLSALKAKVDNLAENGPTVTNRDIAHVQSDVRELKEWKDKVTGVADTMTVPKFGRREKH
jgi:hypothetical protein